MDCHQFEELAGAYALGATNESEHRYAQAHLATCASCSRIACELQEITDRLPLTVPQIEPSPDLHRHVMAAVEADAQAFKRNWQGSGQVQRAPWWLLWRMRLAFAVIVVLLVCVGSLTTWNITMQRQAGSQIYTYALQGTSRDTEARGQAISIPAAQMNIIIVHNLPRLQGTQVYQGWLITPQTVMSIGLLQVVNGTAVLGFPADLQHYTEIAVSIEPGPLATPQVPAGPIVAEGRLQQGQIGQPAGQGRVLYPYLEQTGGQE
jgi:anti-sigma-K factor RskA